MSEKDQAELLPVPMIDLEKLSPEKREELLEDCKRQYIAGYTPTQIAKGKGIRLSTLKRWVTAYNWIESREQSRKQLYFLQSATQDQFLAKSADTLSKVVYLLTEDMARHLADPDGGPMRLPIKTLTDCIDKLKRLQMHISTGGVTKSVHANIDMSQSLLQDVIMEACIEVERKYPDVSARDLIREIFSKHMKSMMDKVK